MFGGELVFLFCSLHFAHYVLFLLLDLLDLQLQVGHFVPVFVFQFSVESHHFLVLNLELLNLLLQLLLLKVQFLNFSLLPTDELSLLVDLNFVRSPVDLELLHLRLQFFDFLVNGLLHFLAGRGSPGNWSIALYNRPFLVFPFPVPCRVPGTFFPK